MLFLDTPLISVFAYDVLQEFIQAKMPELWFVGRCKFELSAVKMPISANEVP